MPVIEKVAGIIKPKSECTDAESIVHAQQIVGFVQARIFSRLPRPLLALQTPLHQ